MNLRTTLHGCLVACLLLIVAALSDRTTGFIFDLPMAQTPDDTPGVVFAEPAAQEGTEALTRTVHLPLVVYEFPFCNDQEDNDIPAQARQLTTATGACRGAFDDDPVGEDDYYWIDLRAGQTLAITLTINAPDADYDLIVYDARQQQVAVSNRSGAIAEQVTYDVGVTGRYFVRLNMFQKASSAPNTYLLTVTVQ